MRFQRTYRLLAAVLVLGVLAWLLRPDAQVVPAQSPLPAAGQVAAPAAALPAFLPPEAAPVIRTIQQGGRFPYRQDGSVFGNREGLLPARERGWYREYTVPTPGLDHRGARRIVTGGVPPNEWYYTADHYQSFRAFEPGAGATQ